MASNLRTPNGYDGSPSTTRKMGIVRLATDAEAAARTAKNVALSPSQGASSVPDATTSVKGKAALATGAEAVTGTDANKIITPSTLTSRLAAPGAIGGTTPAAGTFTTASITTATATTLNATTITTNVAAAKLSLTATTMSAAGTDADIDITLTPKGTGDVNVTGGNLAIETAAKQLQVNGGAVTDFIGQATLTAGTVTVANTNIAAADRVLVTRHGINGSTALGVFDVAITPATSFSITARKTADATTETNDVSIVDYFIVREL